MQLRALLPYLLIFNGFGYQPAQADASGVTIQADYADQDDCPMDDDYGPAECPSWDANCANNDDQSWIPTFYAPSTLPSYQDIINCTNANDANFAAQLATANQLLQTYLDQCVVNGAADEYQIAILVNAIQEIYRAYVRQSVFLAFLKAQRLQDEAQYQAYQTQIAALQASIQQAAQQVIVVWQAVAAGTDTVADALAASQTAATAITALQSQIAQVNTQVDALLTLLATYPDGDDYYSGSCSSAN